MTQSLALYIHWPFCKSKCPYCDFNSHVREKIAHRDWQDAYLKEMRFYRELTGERHIESIFFGGGTPSLMEPETVAAVIDEARHLWGLPQGTEVTLEANPTSVETDKLKAFKAAGVNRVSLGVQALNDKDLKALGRQHSAAEALRAVEMAGSVFERFSFDLIYARPEQTLAEWEAELSQALSYAVGHLSLYQLTIEEGTQFHTLYQRGGLVLPDEDTSADMYELTQAMMSAAEMPAYEISNHARLGDESRHNMMYWKYRDYVGVGPGAHGRLTQNGEKIATRAHRSPEVWMDYVTNKGNGAHPFEKIDKNKRGWEMLMMGLRLAEGVNLDDFLQETAHDISSFLNGKKLTMLQEEGMIEMTKNRLRATAAGRQRLNGVLKLLVTE